MSGEKSKLDKSNRAKLIIHKKDNTKEEFDVDFNPDKYSIKKSNKFVSHSIPGTNFPQIQFISGEAETMSVELFFDTYTNTDSLKKDVRVEFTNKISKMLKIDKDLHAPPVCEFLWGSVSFTGIIENIDINFTMFNEEGVPLRATVTLSLKQYQEQKIITQSSDRTKRFTIKESDSLWLLAANEYGDPTKWKLIALANDIDDPITLKPGTQLIIPPLSEDE